MLFLAFLVFLEGWRLGIGLLERWGREGQGWKGGGWCFWGTLGPSGLGDWGFSAAEGE